MTEVQTDPHSDQSESPIAAAAGREATVVESGPQWDQIEGPIAAAAMQKVTVVESDLHCDQLSSIVAVEVQVTEFVWKAWYILPRAVT